MDKNVNRYFCKRKLHWCFDLFTYFRPIKSARLLNFVSTVCWIHDQALEVEARRFVLCPNWFGTYAESSTAASLLWHVTAPEYEDATDLSKLWNDR